VSEVREGGDEVQAFSAGFHVRPWWVSEGFGCRYLGLM